MVEIAGAPEDVREEVRPLTLVTLMNMEAAGYHPSRRVEGMLSLRANYGGEGRFRMRAEDCRDEKARERARTWARAGECELKELEG